MAPIEAQLLTSYVARPDDAWSEPLKTAERYLKVAGISIPYIRLHLARTALQRLEDSNRSQRRRVRELRLLAAVERVLCESLGAEPGSDTSNPDTARRRLLFSVNPTHDAQLALLSNLRAGHDPGNDSFGEPRLMRIPPVRERKLMPRQQLECPSIPFMSDRIGSHVPER